MNCLGCVFIRAYVSVMLCFVSVCVLLRLCMCMCVCVCVSLCACLICDGGFVLCCMLCCAVLMSRAGPYIHKYQG